MDAISSAEFALYPVFLKKLLLLRTVNQLCTLKTLGKSVFSSKLNSMDYGKDYQNILILIGANQQFVIHYKHDKLGVFSFPVIQQGLIFAT